jgi:hypothetical protein
MVESALVRKPEATTVCTIRALNMAPTPRKDPRLISQSNADGKGVSDLLGPLHLSQAASISNKD